MTTFAGTQSEFFNVLKELAELDYDVIEAYKSAIVKIGKKETRIRLQLFQDDYERHIKKINGILETHGQQVVQGPSGKKWLLEAKVAFANIIGEDKNILKVLLNAEIDINKAYERAHNRTDKWDEITEVLREVLANARNHKEWIETALKECGCSY